MNRGIAIPELAVDVGMCGSSAVDMTLEPVTIAVAIIIAIL
jgi:hypothetical protein